MTARVEIRGTICWCIRHIGSQLTDVIVTMQLIVYNCRFLLEKHINDNNDLGLPLPVNPRNALHINSGTDWKFKEAQQNSTT